MKTKLTQIIFGNYLSKQKKMTAWMVFFMLVGTFSVNAVQTTGSYTSAQVATLKTDLAAGTYDIYELTTSGGAYTISSSSSANLAIGGTKTNVTIRAAAGLSAKPIIKLTYSGTSGSSTILSSAVASLTLTISGIEFNGINATNASYQPMLLQATGTSNNIYVSNCNIHDFLNVAGNGAIRIDGLGSSLDVQGSIFNNCGGRVLNNAGAATQGTAYLKNNTFSNCTSLLNSRMNILYNANSSGTVTVDHCTFYNVANAAVSDGILRVPSGSGTVTVTNNIFSLAATNLTANPLNYCYLAGLTTVPTGTNTFVTAPSYTNTAIRDFTLTNRADFVSSDGLTAGNSSIYPALLALAAPTIGTGSGASISGFTANWTKVSNAISYDVAVYQGASLISTTNASGQATQSLAITGLASNTTYTYKVTAKGDGIVYSPSPASDPSAGILTLGLTVPVVGTASSVSASGFTANWTAVANAVGYDVNVYLGSQLVSTTNVSGQATASLTIIGLAAGTTYTYKVVAKGDGSSYIDSTPSAASTSFTTTAVAVAGISTNFADGTWGSIIPSPTTNLPASGSFPTSSINGFTLTKALMYGGTSTGLQGEYHVNQIRLDKGTLGAMVTLPTVNSISQLEIHVTGSSPKQFVVRQYNTGTSAWDITVGTYTLTGAEDIFYIPVSGTNATFRIENEASSTSSLQIYQIITRTTNPTTVLGTPYQPNSATAITGSGFNASWTAVPNASGYLVRTYSTLGILRNTFNVSGGATTSFATIGMDTVRVGTYKVVAVGDYITYTNSIISPASPTYAIVRLATPGVGVGSVPTSNGFTANWTAVADALSYDVLVYQGATLISTTNAVGQATITVDITGLAEYTAYTYTVIAKGNGTTFFDSYPSTASSSISTLRNLPKVATPVIGTASSVLATGFTANWTAVENAVSYNVSVYQGVTFIKTVNASGQATASVAITGLTAGLAYTYKVVAVGDGATYDDSALSDASAIVTTNKLTTPTIGTASAVTATGFTANWTAVANASSYNVILYSGINAIDTKSASGQATQSIDFTGLTSGFSYTYKVQAIGDGTNYASSAVSVASASVTTNKLSTPTIGTASDITGTGFTANWTAVANAVSYDVKVYDSGATLISTTNATGQATNSLAITGLSNFTIYNYKVTAIGDVNYANSDVSGVSANFITLDPAAVNSITTNLGDPSWGTPSASVPATTLFGTSTVNGFTLTNACLTVSNTKGPKGESHTNRISMDKINLAYITLPTVNSVKQIEIHAIAGTAGNGFSLQEYVPSTNTWVAVGSSYIYDAASKAAGIDSLYIIPITRNVQTKFRIGNIATGALGIYQIITRTTNPVILAKPVITAATAVTGSGFTAHWDAIPNATGYSVKQYNRGTLRNTFTVSDPLANSYIITGIDTASVCTYKVQAIGDGDVNYSDSYLSLPLASFAITRLTTPVVGVGSDVTANGFTANWSTVVNASSYDVLLYQGATLINTTNVLGQATASLNLSGLTSNTDFTYKVKAKGDGSSFFDSYSSSASAIVSTLNTFAIAGVIDASTLPTLSATSAVNVDNGGTLTFNTPKTVGNVTTASGGKLVVSEPLNVTGAVVIEAGAKLDLSNTLTVTGDLTFKADESGSFSAKIGAGVTIDAASKLRYVKTMLDSKWYFMSFPCAVNINEITQVEGGAFVLGNDWYIKYYNGQTRATNRGGSNWVEITDQNAILTANKGYIFGLKTGVGTKHLSIVLDKALVASAENGARPVAVKIWDATAGTHAGWNLVGQPFLSRFTGNQVTAITDKVSIPDAATGMTYTQSFMSSAAFDPFTAYFVQALADDNLSFAITGRSFVPVSADSNLSDIVELNLITSTGTDNTNLIMDSNNSTDYEIGQDLEKWLGIGTDKPQVYTLLGGINYAFNALPINNVINLPVGVYTKTAGKSTISISNPLQAPSLSKLILTDKVTGFNTDLLTSNYTFDATAGTDNARFMITAQRVPTENVFETNSNEPSVSMLNGKLLLINVKGKTSVRVFDALGRMVANKTVSNNSLEIKLSAKGMYTLQIEAGGKCWVKKVVF